MRRQLMIIGVLIIAAMGMLTITLHIRPVKAEMIIVPDHYPSIQAAIDAADPGDIIFVRSGQYNESVTVNKTISLIGESRDSATINGNRANPVLCVTADNVIIMNLTVMCGRRNLWNACGIYVNSSNNVLFNNTIADNNWGMYFNNSHNNNVSSNLIFNNSMALYTTYSHTNTFERNNVTGNDQGCKCEWTDHTVFDQNLVTENKGVGIFVAWGNLCRFERNTIVGNIYGFWVDPVYNSSILENNIVNNRLTGIRFHGYSYDNVIIGNNITGSQEGILFHDTTGTIVARNAISGNERGIAIHGGSSISVYHMIQYNNLTNNTIGMWQSWYNFGQISHNNFIDNDVPARSEYPSYIRWNSSYPSGGNYWSSYSGTDLFRGVYQNIAGSDAIGDEPYAVDENTTDYYPLMASISTFDAGTWDDTSCNVDVVSNSTVSDFCFDPQQGPFIRFNVTGENGTNGFCRVAIPKNMLWISGVWTIFVGTEPVIDYSEATDANYTYIYFTYAHSTKMVHIQGTHVVPEFSSLSILGSFLIVTLVAFIFRRRRQSL